MRVCTPQFDWRFTLPALTPTPLPPTGEGLTYPINTQQLPAPRRAIRTQSDAIQRQTQHGFIHAMFGTHGGDMSVMMLYGDERHIQLGGELCGETTGMEIGMQIVRNGLWFLTELCKQGTRDPFMFDTGFRGIQVTHTLTDECPIVRGDTEGVLEPCTHRQHSGYRMSQLDDMFDAVWRCHSME
jgi:hypothetical protein